MSQELNVIQTAERCRHLLSKGLFINALVPKGQEVTGDGYFWCGHTQTGWGPDDRICDKEPCCNPSRSCYEAP